MPKLNDAKIGDIVIVYGQPCRIFKVHDFGTVDVENIVTGNCYRVTGLAAKLKEKEPAK